MLMIIRISADDNLGSKNFSNVKQPGFRAERSCNASVLDFCERVGDCPERKDMRLDCVLYGVRRLFALFLQEKVIIRVFQLS